MRDYFKWQDQHLGSDFIPNADDDIDLRTYLLDLHINGADLASLEEHTAALKCFYQWVKAEGVIAHNPFDEYNFLYPFLTSELIGPRQQILSSDLNEREVERLHALYQIVEHLVSSVDIQSAIDSTLRTLLKVMKLQTGWLALLTESHLGVIPAGDLPPHGFALVAAYGLPPVSNATIAAFFGSRLPATARIYSEKDASHVPSTSSNAHVWAIPCAPQVITRICAFTPARP